jgi:hypothetical protein
MKSKRGSKRKSLPKLKKELQTIFNEFIRLRDKGLNCISCDKPKELQAGHFFPVKLYDGLRYDEWNVNGECAGCNCFNDAHLIFYTENLELKIGKENFLMLKYRADHYKKFGYKWSRSELEEKIIYYTEKVKQLKETT